MWSNNDRGLALYTPFNHTFYLFVISDQMTIEDFLESEDPSIPGKVCIALDLQPDEKWQKLGIKLGVEHQDLSAIKIDCANQHQNPAGDVIEVICAKKPTMTISQFKEHLKNIKRTDVKNKLGNLKGMYDAAILVKL